PGASRRCRCRWRCRSSPHSAIRRGEGWPWLSASRRRPQRAVQQPDDVFLVVRTPNDVAIVIAGTPDDVPIVVFDAPDDVAVIVGPPDNVAVVVARTPDDVAVVVGRAPDDVVAVAVRARTAPDDVTPRIALRLRPAPFHTGHPRIGGR